VVVAIDIPCDVQQIDETGYIWTFLHEARDPALILPGAIVTTADVDEPVVAEVVDVVEEAAGEIVHLVLLPGLFEDYEALVRRCIS
jgi:hypothetical protein